MVASNLMNNENLVIKETRGEMQVAEYKRDMSVSSYTSKEEYYAAKMNVNRRQILINANGTSYVLQSGAMQWTSGDVKMTSNVKGAGDLIGKMVASKVTNESAIKPMYSGVGQIMLEPTYRHLILTDPADWGGSLVIDDGLFLACDARVQQKVTARTNLSSAVLGGEGLFNLSLNGAGVVALESNVPREELIEIELTNDTIKIDGNMAIAWSGSLEFTVEKSTKSLIGSAVSGEGFVNVYRGTGKIWMAPVISNWATAGTTSITENASTGQTGSTAAKASDVIGAIADIAELFT